MPNGNDVAVTPARWLPSDIVDRLLAPLAHLLRTGNPHATIDRLFTSQHVKDLQLIVAVAIAAIMLVVGIGLPLSVESQVVSQWPEIEKSPSDWVYLRVFFAALNSFITIVAPVMAAFGAVLTWAYQIGSTRLGVVDLFACEISTLCRVAAVVDTVSGLVKRFEHGPPAERTAPNPPAPAPAHQFSSQENYFPVFEGNTKDLQTLEATVVVNITAFYTYMKAVRDSMRRWAEITPPVAKAGAAPADDPWHEAARDVIFLLYLGLESARLAIADLVEVQPERVERTIVVLLSELAAYHYLLGQFTDPKDIHYRRIKLRDPVYRDEVPALCAKVEAGRARERAIRPGTKSLEPSWKPAAALLDELQSRFEEAGLAPAAAAG